MAENNFDCGKCAKDCFLNCFVKIPISVFAGVMLWIGANALTKDANDCPSAEQMPVILVVGGALACFFVNFRQFLGAVCGCCGDKMKDRECMKVGGKMMRFGLQLGYDCFVVNVCILWCVISSIYVANNVEGSTFDYWKNLLGDNFDAVAESIQGAESTIDPASQDVWLCSANVYNMTILSIIMGYIVAVLALIFLVIAKVCNVVCCKMCDDSSEGTV